MPDNYNYPLGADNESAPWNQVEPPEKDFNVVISQTLSKSVVVTTTNYTPYVDEEDGTVYAETDDTNWHEEFIECGYYTPLDLIGEFKRLLELRVEQMEDGPDRQRYNQLIEECSNWVEDDIEIFKDE